jgi:hypothetical protein
VSKPRPIHLTASETQELEAIAHAEGKEVTDVIRAAIAEHLSRRLSDPGFRERLELAIARSRRVLDRLADA